VALAVVAGMALGAPAVRADTTLTSCSPSAFAAAVAAGGTVTFGVDCSNLILAGTVIVPSGKVLDIEGNGHAVALSGNGQRRLFTVTGGQLTVRGVTIRSGAVVGADGANGGAGSPGARSVAPGPTAPTAPPGSPEGRGARAAPASAAASGAGAAPGARRKVARS
jgi:hypothetical protein